MSAADQLYQQHLARLPVPKHHGPRRIVGEKHLLPSRLTVSLAFALGMEPPHVLAIGLNKDGLVEATRPIPFRQWHFQYVTLRMVRP